MKKSSSYKSIRFNIPDEQWSLPVGYSPDGKEMLTLQDVIEHKRTSLSLGEITDQKMAELVAKRIEAQPRFKIATIGMGVINKKQALEEVRAQSPIGRNLMEIEQILISSLFEHAKKMGRKNGKRT